jgi:hypothetical protein
MTLVNNLGTFETLDQVWDTYSEGGKEGDYLYIGDAVYKWDKYIRAWTLPTEEDLSESTIEERGEVVESTTPIEFVIDDADIIEGSTRFINYLGGFEDRDTVWKVYPEGGDEGDYLYISEELHIWDKYIRNWVATTPPDESSQMRPIEPLFKEGVVEYSEEYVNYLGAFESIEQAWEVYPEGGKEGDYIIVGEEQLRWNKYINDWGEVDPSESTPARPMATVWGDLHVANDLIVSDDIIAKIFDKYAPIWMLSKLTPIRVESEEKMQQMIDTGMVVEGQIYYVPEEI